MVRSGGRRGRRGRRARRVGAASLVASVLAVASGCTPPPAAALDHSFGGGDGIVTTDLGGFEDAAAVVRQPDGKLVAVGRAGDDVVAGGDILVARYRADGRLDRSFGGGDGIVVTDVAGRDDGASGVALQRDGRIVVVGRTWTGEVGDPANPNLPVDFTDSVVVRYKADGRLDRSFGGGDGIVVTDVGPSGDEAKDVAVQPDGRIVVSGDASVGSVLFLTSRFAVVRYERDGRLDRSFGSGGVAVLDSLAGDNAGAAVELQRDGTILVAGEAGGSPFLSAPPLVAARLLADGRLDLSFGGGDGVAEAPFGTPGQWARGTDMLVQRDGKVVVVGSVTTSPLPTTTLFAVARFTPDGALDPGFDGDGMARTMMGFAESSAAGVAVQRDGKLVAVGSALDQATRTWRHAIARYNVDGTLDATFDGDGRLTTPAIGTASPARDVLVQPDGRIVTAGGVGPSGDVSDVALVRFAGDRTGPAGHASSSTPAAATATPLGN